jgi:NTP pyrophosphatase (non-canonical NTP hydrolase)
MKSVFKENDTLSDFQRFIQEVYALPDDRLYSLWDLLVQEQRFSMRALKGIRKEDYKKVRLNLVIALAWLMSISNRLRLNAENELWKRFPALCSYCGECPCACKKIKLLSRRTLKIDKRLRPRTVRETQMMFQKIYPRRQRKLNDAGIHLAEEVGEVSEAIHNYLGQHEMKQFIEIKKEISDLISCIFGVANSLPFDVAKELATMYNNNCYVCHQAPCICSFTDIVRIAT